MTDLAAMRVGRSSPQLARLIRAKPGKRYDFSRILHPAMSDEHACRGALSCDGHHSH